MNEKDLVVLAADSNIEQALIGLFTRPEALGIRPIDVNISVHPQHDPGCATRGVEFLSERGPSCSTRTGAKAVGLERLGVRLIRHDDVAGWKNRHPSLRRWLISQGYLQEGTTKPERPKEALEAALRTVRKPRSASLYRQLAERVSLRRCNDPSFSELKRVLTAWFPAGSPVSRREIEGARRNDYAKNRNRCSRERTVKPIVMRLSWNEIRSRAAQFATEWANATYESGETQSFYNEFFEIFDVRRRTVARYEEHVRRLDNSHGFIDLFWPGVLLVEQKSAGRDLTAARKQAGTYFDALPERDRPRYQLLCDFQTFELLDRDEREETRFALADLPQHVEKFGFIIGVQRRTFRDQDPVNIEASERIARLHDALADSGYDGHDLELFLVRMVFCLFADDTGIFEPRDIFLQFIEERTSPDGSDLGPYLARLFQVLNTPEERRQTKLDEDLARFPYVNGELFAEPLRIPDFDAEMRQSLLDACLFDWTAISPAIFGALFQSVMEPAERRAQGAHYTTEQNIRKVIEPLFLDDLRAEFARLKARRDNRRIPDLYTFQQKLGQLTFLDPACGCGNFLIIAYRELRQLEIEVLRELHPSGQLSAFAELLSVVNVDQFYGIEISEFPARIAETALWMMDHIMNNRLSLEFGQTYARIPLEQSPHIQHGDALTMDWAELLPPEGCSYVLGNPPFVRLCYAD